MVYYSCNPPIPIVYYELNLLTEAIENIKRLNIALLSTPLWERLLHLWLFDLHSSTSITLKSVGDNIHREL